MQKRNQPITSLPNVIAVIVTSFCLFVRCTEQELLPTITQQGPTGVTAAAAAVTSSCGCTYTVQPTMNGVTVDGQVLGIKPGAVICLQSGTYGNIVFRNLRGTAVSPITIKNCGGVATVNATGRAYGLKTQTSAYLRITGGAGTAYDIKVNGGNLSIQLEALTTNIELDHLEVFNSGFSGIMAKTDPTCDNATIRGNFVMRDVWLHDNFIHDTGAEGIYVGHSSWLKGVTATCGVRMPHAMEGVKIHNNVVKNSGWEAIQIGSAPNGAEVYGNRVENYGTKNTLYQNNGVQFGEGATGKFYGNFIKGGKGHGLMILGNAWNFVHDNVIINAGGDGIFCEDRVTGAGFQFINNTIINPALNGIRIYADEVIMNNVLNNIIVNPGSYSTYTYPRTGNDAYVYLLSKTVKVQMLNNYFTRDINAVKFVSPTSYNYALTGSSVAALNKGASISSYSITLDHANKPRVKGTEVDIGAYEFQ